MKSRKEILEDVVLLQGNIDALKQELSKYPWDSTVELLQFTKENLTTVIERCLSKEIAVQELIKWANIIECRDDIGFNDETVRQIIFEIANPEIYEELTIERLTEFMNIT